MASRLFTVAVSLLVSTLALGLVDSLTISVSISLIREFALTKHFKIVILTNKANNWVEQFSNKFYYLTAIVIKKPINL